MKVEIGTLFSEIAKVLFSFTAGVYLFGDFLIRYAIMETQVWVTDTLWFPEIVFMLSLSIISFTWFVYSLDRLVRKLFQKSQMK